MAAQSRGESPAARRERLAKLLKHYNFEALRSMRVAPIEEQLYATINPKALREPDHFVGEVLVSMLGTCLMRRRAYALRVWLARRLARMADHAALAAAWRGAAREDLYGFRLYTRALRHARGGK